jgi:hypothetical protein
VGACPHGGVIDGLVPPPFRSGDGTSAIRVIVRRQGKTIDQFLPERFGRFTTGWLEPGTYVLSVEDGLKGLIGRREVVISADSKCVSIESIVDRAPPR